MDCYNLILVLISLSIFLRIKGLQSENIVNGKHAAEGKFKYQVTLFCNELNICGGALIGSRFVLTAAHCILNTKCHVTTNQIQVVAGIVELHDYSKKTRVERGVRNAYVPNNYGGPALWDYDIAVLELVDGINFIQYPHIGVVRLPTNEYAWDLCKGLIAGFGWDKINVKKGPETNEDVEEGGNNEHHLNYVIVKVLPNSVCRLLHPFHVDVKDIHLCSKTIKSTQTRTEGACVGDSGSPLVIGNTVVGILNSTPAGCDDQQLGSLYARVSEYVKFIKIAMKNPNRNDTKIYKVPEELQFRSNQKPNPKKIVDLSFDARNSIDDNMILNNSNID